MLHIDQCSGVVYGYGMAGWVLIVHITLSAHGIACHCTSVVNLCSMLAHVRESVRLLRQSQVFWSSHVKSGSGFSGG